MREEEYVGKTIKSISIGGWDSDTVEIELEDGSKIAVAEKRQQLLNWFTTKETPASIARARMQGKIK